MLNMVSISRDGTKVKVTIDPGMSDEKVALLYWECNSNWYAELMVSRMSDKLDSTVQVIREEEHNKGWEDKTKRKPKREWFSSRLGKLW